MVVGARVKRNYDGAIGRILYYYGNDRFMVDLQGHDLPVLLHRDRLTFLTNSEKNRG